VPYLYQHFGGFAAWHTPPTLTIEADILTPDELLPQKRPLVADSLRASGLVPSNHILPAARWLAPPPRGEQVEFLAAHAGPMRNLGQARRIVGQEGISAVCLPGVAVLGRHTTTLRLPLRAGEARHLTPASPEGPASQSPSVSVRVPQLGVFTLQKAATFAARLGSAGTHPTERAAKDLLYLRDIGAGGAAVAARVVQDVASATATDSEIAGLITVACANLEGVMRGALNSLLSDIARMRLEREANLSLDAARADAAGHLSDLLDRLRGMSTN
jgi:hypothetical protein